MFDNILKRKKAFLGSIKKSLKSRTFGIFPKGVGPWFWSKI